MFIGSCAFMLACGIFFFPWAFSTESYAQSRPVVLVEQGTRWTNALRDEFYTTDQGSRIMPLAWMRALEVDGEGFLDDQLTRYGYLARPGTDDGVPIGFTVARYRGEATIGMTCSACHTRQISVSGTDYRIDGGPALADFQSFLTDLDEAVAAVLASDTAFESFAKRVAQASGQPVSPDLRARVEVWYKRFHTLMDRSLPSPAWGPGRLDAVSMIFNRLTGLDIGTTEDRIIAENIKRADAPTRYPFLWNAARQDLTQWPGFASNGNDILGLARNLGEVYGVFADFHPTRQDNLFGLNRDYVTINSANFEGLKRLEELIWEIGPPRWPWQVDQQIAAEGEAIFNRDAEEGGCVSCHGARRGALRSPLHSTFLTPIQDVGTDSRECLVLQQTVSTGVMEGARIPFVTDVIRPTDTAFNVLRTAVLGAIIQHVLRQGGAQEGAQALATSAELATPPEFEYLKDAFRPEALPQRQTALEAATAPLRCAYEARVLEGIWAAAPYLHNGSVPTLEQLLKPASERVASFRLGPEYDIEGVGLAVEQPRTDYVLETTDCSDIESGNSRCGHEYGTGLSAEERRALLEYLKLL